MHPSGPQATIWRTFSRYSSVIIITARMKAEAPSSSSQSRWKNEWGCKAGCRVGGGHLPRDASLATRHLAAPAESQCSNWLLPSSFPTPDSSGYLWGGTRANSGNSPVPEFLRLVLEPWQVYTRLLLVCLGWDCSFLTFTLQTHSVTLLLQHLVWCSSLPYACGGLSTLNESCVHRLGGGWPNEVRGTTAPTCSFSTLLPGSSFMMTYEKLECF